MSGSYRRTEKKSSGWSGNTGSARSVGKAFFPLDEELGLGAERLTPHAHECLVRFGAWMPFQKAAAELAFSLCVVVSEPTARRYAQAAGEAYVDWQTAEVERLERETPEPPAGPEKMFFSVDGAMVPLLGGEWTEVKTMTLGEIPAAVLECGEWVVHCKPVGNGRTALKYLAPYVFRVAISNLRLVKLENGRITFRYYATDTSQLKLCTLSAEEFIRRFLQHVLPKGFVKVRYFGFFAPGCRKHLAGLRQRLELTHPCCANEAESTQEPADLSPEPKLCCPSCGQPLLFRCEIQPTGRCPP